MVTPVGLCDFIEAKRLCHMSHSSLTSCQGTTGQKEKAGTFSTGLNSCGTRMQRNPRILALDLILNGKSSPLGGRSLNAA